MPFFTKYETINIYDQKIRVKKKYAQQLKDTIDEIIMITKLLDIETSTTFIPTILVPDAYFIITINQRIAIEFNLKGKSNKLKYITLINNYNKTKPTTQTIYKKHFHQILDYIKQNI